MATHSSVLAWRIPGTGSLVGCRLWGRTESDTTEVTQQQQQQQPSCLLPSHLSLIFRDMLSFSFSVNYFHDFAFLSTYSVCFYVGIQEDSKAIQPPPKLSFLIYPFLRFYSYTHLMSSSISSINVFECFFLEDT